MRLRKLIHVPRKNDYILCRYHQVNEQTDVYRLSFAYRFSPRGQTWDINVDLHKTVTNGPYGSIQNWVYFRIRDWHKKAKHYQATIWSSDGGWWDENRTAQD